MLRESRNANFRKAKIGWICNSGIQAESCGINVVVSEHILLPKAVISNPKLIGESRGRHPDPASTHYLRSCISYRQKQRVEDSCIFFRLSTVSNKVCADKGVLLRKMIIELGNSVIFTVAIIKIQIQSGGWPGIVRQKFSQLLTDAATGRGCGAPRQSVRKAVTRITGRGNRDGR